MKKRIWFFMVLLSICLLCFSTSLALSKPSTPSISNATLAWTGKNFELNINWQSTVNPSGFDAEALSSSGKLVSGVCTGGKARSTKLTVNNNDAFQIRIRAYNESGSQKQYSAYSKIYTVKKVSISVSAINDATGRDNLIIGHSKSLSATTAPSGFGNEIQWSTSNKSIASIDAKGNITGKALGKVSITATVKSTGQSKSVDYFVYPYSINDAINYAEKYWDKDTDDLCSAYVSLAIGAGRHGVKGGGIGVDRCRTPDGLLTALKNYSQGVWHISKVTKASQIKKGDIVFYLVKNDKTYRHVTICVNVVNGVPLVDSHNHAKHQREYNYYWNKDSNGNQLTGDCYVMHLSDGI